MSRTTIPTAPGHLEPATRKWWRAVVKDYELEAHQLRVLTLAGELWDRAQAARAVLDREGLTYTDRFGAPRARPEAAIARDATIAFIRAVRELGLDLDEPGERRPPIIKPKSARRAG